MDMKIYTKRDGIQRGPYTIAKILAKLKDGTLSQSDLAWHENASSWQPIRDCDFIQRELPPPTPAPPMAPPLTMPSYPPPPPPHVVTELTSKGLKLRLALSYGMCAVGLFLTFGGVVPAGPILLIVGIFAAIATRISIWWHHK